ncbi:MAG: hypoxanthine phosphoribosyltransferase [Calditrichaeota bacterium]|nr:MAG: hypoxanthine phosphoribosyltransferase [Calditrichota bacterium]
MNNEKLAPENFKVLISEARIQQRLRELGAEISRDFQDSKPIMIGILNGGFIFLADLIRHIETDLEIDFMRISSYGNHKESTGHVKVLKPLSADINGRDVIVVEDIVDSGLSLQFLEKLLSAFRPNRLKFATLLHKPSKTRVPVRLDYVGFEVEDKYVVGYGLDEEQLKRNLRQIYVVNE